MSKRSLLSTCCGIEISGVGVVIQILVDCMVDNLNRLELHLR